MATSPFLNSASPPPPPLLASLTPSPTQSGALLQSAGLKGAANSSDAASTSHLGGLSIAFIVLFSLSAVLNAICCRWAHTRWWRCRACAKAWREFGERRGGVPLRCAACRKPQDVRFECMRDLAWQVAAVQGAVVGLRAEHVLGLPASSMQHLSATVSMETFENAADYAFRTTGSTSSSLHSAPPHPLGAHSGEEAAEARLQQGAAAAWTPLRGDERQPAPAGSLAELQHAHAHAAAALGMAVYRNPAYVGPGEMDPESTLDLDQVLSGAAAPQFARSLRDSNSNVQSAASPEAAAEASPEAPRSGSARVRRGSGLLLLAEAATAADGTPTRGGAGAAGGGGGRLDEEGGAGPWRTLFPPGQLSPASAAQRTPPRRPPWAADAPSSVDEEDEEGGETGSAVAVPPPRGEQLA